jgi:hypothetical protein
VLLGFGPQQGRDAKGTQKKTRRRSTPPPKKNPQPNNPKTQVICIDNFFTGSKENVQHLLSKPNFELMRHDVVEKVLLEVDQVYHLACPASPVHYKYNPIKTIKTSFVGTMNMLGLAKRTRARFLLASTSEVYGDPLEHPQTENYWGNVNPIGERSCYDEGKRAAECLAMDYHREHGLEIRIVRIFNTYGPRMALDDGRVVSNFVAQALQVSDERGGGGGGRRRRTRRGGRARASFTTWAGFPSPSRSASATPHTHPAPPSLSPPPFRPLQASVFLGPPPPQNFNPLPPPPPPR